MSKWCRSGSRWVASVGLVVIVGLLLAACGGSAQYPMPGNPAPDFTLKDLQGRDVKLSQFKGKPVLLNFWASWCEPCRLELPLIEATQQKHQGQDLVILGVNNGEPPEVVQSFVNENHLTFPVVLDASNEVSRAYQVNGIPSSVFINSDGQIVNRHSGVFTERILSSYLNNILKK